MKIDFIENALSGIDEKTIDSISEERYRKMGKGNVKSQKIKISGFSKKIIAISAAAALFICIFAVTIPLFLKSPSDIGDPNDSESVNPQHIENLITPELEELNKTEPYSELLPKRLLSGCSFVSSYMTINDPVANPEDHKYLALNFKMGSETWSTMEIKVSEYDGSPLFADIHNKNTFAISNLYGANAGPAENLQGFSELFHSEDVSKDIVEEMVYTTSGGLCKAEISVLCGDYIVSYAYAGPEITSDAFYDMIISSDYMQNKL